MQFSHLLRKDAIAIDTDVLNPGRVHMGQLRTPGLWKPRNVRLHIKLLLDKAWRPLVPRRSPSDQTTTNTDSRTLLWQFIVWRDRVYFGCPLLSQNLSICGVGALHLAGMKIIAYNKSWRGMDHDEWSQSTQWQNRFLHNVVRWMWSDLPLSHVGYTPKYIRIQTQCQTHFILHWGRGLFILLPKSW